MLAITVLRAGEPTYKDDRKTMFKLQTRKNWLWLQTGGNFHRCYFVCPETKSWLPSPVSG